MRKCAIFIFAVAGLLSAETHIPAGNISGVWTAEGSPYYIDGEVHIPTDSMLVIEPGCSVVFAGTFKLVVDSNAVLKAIGTETDSIVFTLLYSFVPWYGIRFNCAAEGCTLGYCKVEYSDSGGIWCYNSNLVILNSTIKENNLGGIHCNGSNITVRNCIIERNSRPYGGIYCENSFITIENNIIRWNLGTGGGMSCYICDGVITHNTISEDTADVGGGLSISHSSVVIEDNIITGNSACTGGGIYIGIDTNSLIINNTITENTAWEGGGISCYGATIENNIVSENFASDKGGGIACGSVEATGIYTRIRNNLISSNNCGFYGGGIYICCEYFYPDTNNVIIDGNIIINNSASYGGGIISMNAQGVQVINNFINNNSADCGGGLGYSGGRDIFTFNNIVSHNFAHKGGGVFFGGSWIYSFANNTIADNSAHYGGGIYCRGYSRIAIFNTIFFNNSADTAGNEIYSDSDSSTGASVFYITHSNIDSMECLIPPGAGGIVWASGIINSDPLFADTLFHLSSTSPCIDAGAESVHVSIWDTVIYAPDYDFDGGVRPYGAGWDIGADEYGSSVIAENSIKRPEEIEISAYPNPFNSACVITAPAGARVEIYDLRGRLVYTSPSVGIKNGKFRWSPDQSVPSGVYLIRAITPDGQVAQKKVVLIR